MKEWRPTMKYDCQLDGQNSVPNRYRDSFHHPVQTRFGATHSCTQWTLTNHPPQVAGWRMNGVWPIILLNVFVTWLISTEVTLTLWGPTSSYARQCVPLHKVQRRAQLNTLYCCVFCRFQEAHTIYYVLYELLGGWVDLSLRQMKVSHWCQFITS